MSNRTHYCIDCKHCNVSEMKCYPESEDCASEYDLVESDLYTAAVCDFFHAKEMTINV